MKAEGATTFATPQTPTMSSPSLRKLMYEAQLAEVKLLGIELEIALQRQRYDTLRKEVENITINCKRRRQFLEAKIKQLGDE